MDYLESISQELLIIGVFGLWAVIMFFFISRLVASSPREEKVSAPLQAERTQPPTHPGKRYQWGSSTIRVTGSKSNYGHVLHSVVLEAGPWPDDHALIVLCDGRTPGRGGSLGGRVIKTSARTAQVRVHTD